MNKLLFLSIIFMSVVLFLHTQQIYASNTLFVAPYGDDRNNGSFESPLKSIQNAIDQSVPGTTIYIREGIYHELVKIHDKDNVEKLIIKITPYNEEEVIIDGTPLSITSSERAGFSIRNSSYIHIDGLIIKNIKTTDRDIFPAGIITRGNSHHITISNNQITNIANEHVNGNAHGIIVYGNTINPIHTITIESNKLQNLKTGRSESLTVSGNVENFKIARNYLANNNNIGIDIAGHYGACVDYGCKDYARNGIVSHNIILHHSSLFNPSYNGKNSAPGIYIDGAKQIKVFGNYVAYNNYGISIGSENNKQFTQQVDIFENYIIKSDKAGIVIGGSSEENGGAKQIDVRDNLFIENDQLRDGYKEITLQNNIRHLIIQNNRYKSLSKFLFINHQSENLYDYTFKNNRPIMQFY